MTTSRSAFRFLPRLLALAAALLVPALVAAQPAPARSQAELAARWREAPDDTAALGALARESAVYGDTLLWAVLATAADPGRGFEARLHALSVLGGYFGARHPWGILAVLREAADLARRPCSHVQPWAAGDTLLGCGFPGRSVSSAPSMVAPIPGGPRNVVLDTLEALIRSDPDVRIRGAAWRLSSSVRWARDARATLACGAAGCAPRRAVASRAPVDTARVHALGEVSLPPALRNERAVTTFLGRGYPPLLRDADVEGTAVFEVTVGRDGAARARLVRGSGHAAMDSVAARALARMELAPARVGETPVKVRFELPVFFGRGLPRGAVTRPVPTR